jgi:hypothetical protein
MDLQKSVQVKLARLSPRTFEALERLGEKERLAKKIAG